MTETVHKRRKVRWGISIAVLAGCGAVGVFFALNKARPPRQERVERVPHVEVVSVEPQVFEAPIVAYGTVRPKRQIKIIPQVTGRLIRVHEKLAAGNFIPKGELLFEIDPRPYKAKVQQVKAEIDRLGQELIRLDKDQASLEKRLELAEKLEKLAEGNLSRENKLMAADATNQLEQEMANERFIRQQDVVLNYEHQLNMIPVMVAETKAMLTTKEAQLKEAELLLENTEIYCPCDVRVDAVAAQASQVVVASLQIASLTDMEALEVSVVLDPRDLRWTGQEIFASAVGKESDDAPVATVSWTLMGRKFTWQGRVTRLERVDEMTRTAHVVVEIRDVLAELDLGEGLSLPPLTVGMFCEAQLPTVPLEDALVVPRHAVQDGQYVYVYQPEGDTADRGRLVVKRVPLLRTAGDQVLVSYGVDGEAGAATQPATDVPRNAVCELMPGDMVVVSPLPKAVEGMRLRLREPAQPVTETAGRDSGRRLYAGLDCESSRCLHADCGVQ